MEAARLADRERLAEKEALILEFARRSSIEPHKITDEDLQKLKDAGLSDEEIVEMQFTMALSTAQTKFLDSLGVAPDPWLT